MNFKIKANQFRLIKELDVNDSYLNFVKWDNKSGFTTGIMIYLLISCIGGKNKTSMVCKSIKDKNTCVDKFRMLINHHTDIDFRLIGDTFLINGSSIEFYSIDDVNFENKNYDILVLDDCYEFSKDKLDYLSNNVNHASKIIYNGTDLFGFLEDRYYSTYS